MFIWSNEDPRKTIYKRANIVIIRPSPDGGNWEAGHGYVETKNEYYIHTSFANRPSISEGDDWDEIWQWIRMPDYK